MRASRILFFIVLLTSVLGFTPLAPVSAQQRTEPRPLGQAWSESGPLGFARTQRRSDTYAPGEHGLFVVPAGGGIKEVISDKYKARFEEWKDEFLSTDTGRRQWDNYAHHTNFLLTIIVSRDNCHGAGTGKYKWDDSGELIAATITLGCRIDEGYPDPIYYPVMNSLAPRGSTNVLSGNILAAAKIAHEFGHVNRMTVTDGALYRLQSQLIPAYNTILLSNGRDTGDPRLVDLARRMGGTPVEIWEDREYWGEANAMLYLCDRITKESLQCSIFNRINHSVELYAKSYVERFAQVAQSKPSVTPCGWQK